MTLIGVRVTAGKDQIVSPRELGFLEGVPQSRISASSIWVDFSLLLKAAPALSAVSYDRISMIVIADAALEYVQLVRCLGLRR